MPTLQSFILSLPALLIALTLHEFAHAWVAYRLGDPTAKNLGRLTINPIKHLDPLGTIFFIIFHFGWAKPVPVNPFHFKGDRKKGMLWVSLAGPATNLMIAVISAVIFKVFAPQGYLEVIILLIFRLNIVLAVFNLIPIPPLDGSKILAGILPNRYNNFLYNIDKYGYVILILLMITGVLNAVLWPVVGLVEGTIIGLLGI